MIDNNKLWSPEAEAGVLGSMMLDPKAIPAACCYISSPEMFFDHRNQIIYDCLLSMYMAKKPADGVTVRDQLKSSSKFEDAGGIEHLTKTLQSVPTSANIEYYAKIVVDKHAYRGLAATISEIGNEIKDGGKAVDLIKKAQVKISNIETNFDGVMFMEYSAAAKISEEDDSDIIPTGFRNIDYYIKGLRKGSVMVIAARKSVGKSALMLGMATNIAKDGYGRWIFSLESSNEDVVRRSLLAADVGDVEKLPIVVSTIGDTTESQVSLFRQIKGTHNIQCVFIDYLQLMRTTEHYTSVYQTVTQLSKQVKRFAVSEDIPIVLLAQLNRQSENREGKRPRISDLRDSGGIEQDADVILLLHKEESSTEAIIAKHRNGPTGIAHLIFLEKRVEFMDMSHARE